MAARSSLEDLQASTTASARINAGRAVEFSQKLAALEAENSMHAQRAESGKAREVEGEEAADALQREVGEQGKELARLEKELAESASEKDVWSLQRESYSHQLEERSEDVKKLRKEREVAVDKYRKYRKQCEGSARSAEEYRREAEEEGRKNHELSIESAAKSGRAEKAEEALDRMKRDFEENVGVIEELRRDAGEACR